MNQKRKNLKMFGRLIRFVKPYKTLFAFSASCVILLSFLSPFRPYLIGAMVDRYIVDSQNAELLLTWSFGIAGLLLAEGVLQFASSYFSNLLAQSVIRDIRKNLFKHIVSFRMRYFDKTPVGALVTRVVSDLEAITQVFSGIMEDPEINFLDGAFSYVYYKLAAISHDAHSYSAFNCCNTNFCKSYAL